MNLALVWLSSVLAKENPVSYQKPLIGLIVYLQKKVRFSGVLCFMF